MLCVTPLPGGMSCHLPAWLLGAFAPTPPFCFGRLPSCRCPLLVPPFLCGTCCWCKEKVQLLHQHPHGSFSSEFGPVAGDHTGTGWDSWRKWDHCCPQSHQHLHCTHFLIPAPLSPIILFSRSSMLLFQVSSIWLRKAFSSRRSSCEQVHSLSQLPWDGTWRSPGKSLEWDPQRDTDSGCQAAKVPVCHSGDEVPLTFSSIASLNCCCTLFQCCFWPEIWLCSSCILSSSRSIFASNWLKLTLLPKAALSAF